MEERNYVDICPQCSEDALYGFEESDIIWCIVCAWNISTAKWMEYTALRRGFTS